jgi:hypothetical protein
MTLSQPGNRLIFQVPTLNVLRQCLLFLLLVTAFTVPATSRDSEGFAKAEILAFDLLPATNSTSSGLIDVSLGPGDGKSNQRVSLLTSLYTTSDAMLEVPIATICSAESLSGWNAISQPATGTVVVVGANESDTEDVLGSGVGTVVVKWRPTSSSSKADAVLGLTLRKGRGGRAKNVTVIESKGPNARARTSTDISGARKYEKRRRVSMECSKNVSS